MAGLVKDGKLECCGGINNHTNSTEIAVVAYKSQNYLTMTLRTIWAVYQPGAVLPSLPPDHVGILGHPEGKSFDFSSVCPRPFRTSGCFHKFRDFFVDVLIIRALPFGVHVKAPHFGKLSYILAAYEGP